MVLEGTDNYGRPRQEFADRISQESDEGLVLICEDYVWLSAYASNNPRSDYHWMVDACYDEAKARGKVELYDRGWRRASGRATR